MFDQLVLPVILDSAVLAFVRLVLAMSSLMIFAVAYSKDKTWVNYSPIVVNFFWQTLQLYGFSPECVRLWTSKFPFSAKILPHPSSSHSKRFMPLCEVFWCRSSLEAREKLLVQPWILQTKRSMFRWLPSWCLRCYFSLKFFPQSGNEHLNSRSGS